MADSAVVGILRAMLTLDTASYEAGAKKAIAADDKMQKSIGGLGKEVVKLTPQAEKMVKAFGGDKLLYTANSLTQAITKIGGATKLTEAEQARANRTLTDAIQKYSALGQQAPAAMLALQKETAGAGKEINSLGGMISKIGPALAASFSVGAVVSFARGVATFASEMTDLSTQTGIGVEQLQALNYVGAAAGLTIQDITAAATQLANRIGSGDTSAEAAIRRLGLSVEAVREMAPDELLLAISDGFQKITNQNERTATSWDLFGRSGAGMLRLFDGNLRELMAQAERTGAVLSKELIDKAARFDDAWHQAYIRVQAGLVDLADAWLTPPWEKQKESAAQWGRMLDGLAKKAGRPLIVNPQVQAPAGPTDAENKAIEAQSAALLKAAEAAETYQAAVLKLYQDLGGATAVKAVRQLADAWGLLSPAQQANSQIVAEVLKRYQALRAEVGDNVAPALERLFALTGTLTNQTKAWTDAITAVPPAVEAAADSIEGRLIPAGHGLEALFASSARMKAANDELERLGMIAPEIAIENERVSESVEKQAGQWGMLAEAVRRSVGQLESASIGNLGTLFFGFGSDNREAKRAADEAEQDYLRIKRSGKATAEELTLAFKRFHEATERANHGFAERFKDWGQGLLRTFQDVLNDMLKYFTEKFLVGLAKGMAGAKGMFGGGGGGGLGGGDLLGGAAQKGLSKLLGLGAGAGAAGMVPGLGLPAGAAAAAPGVGAAPGAAAGGGSFLTNPAFWTNPWTIGIGITAGLLTWAIAKKGLFRGGWEGIEGNKRRNKFTGQFGDPSIKGVGGADHNLAKKLTAFGQGEGGGPLMTALHSGNKKTFEAAEDGIIRLFAAHGIPNVKKYNFGGFVQPGAIQPAILHGGGMGELAAPMDKIAAMIADRQSAQGAGGTHVSINNYISAIDAKGVRDFVESPAYLRAHARIFEQNLGYVQTRVQRSFT